MLRIASLLLVLVTGSAFAAPVPKELQRTDEQAILGTWEMVRYSCYGQDQVLTKRVQWQLDADGKGALINANGRQEREYKLLPAESAKSPKGFDYSWDYFKMKGLYRLDGDTLKIALNNDGGKVRAAELAPGKDVWYWEFKRVASEK